MAAGVAAATAGSIPLAAAVVGGTPSQQVPSIARLSVVNATGAAVFNCTGTLVAPQLVMSAARCAFDPRTGQPLAPQQVRITLGETVQNLVTGVGNALETHATTDAVVVAAQPSLTDVALFTLDRPSVIPPTPIATTLPQPGTQVTFLGFGGTQANGLVAASPQLKRGTAALLPANGCATGGGNFLCLAAGGDQVCPGDAGGPLNVTVNGVVSTIGIVSSGIRFPDLTCQTGTRASSLPGLKAVVDNFAALRARGPQLLGLQPAQGAAAVSGQALAGTSAMLVPTTTLTQLQITLPMFLSQFIGGGDGGGARTIAAVQAAGLVQPGIQQIQPGIQQFQPGIQQFQPGIQQIQPGIQQNPPILQNPPIIQQNPPIIQQNPPFIQQNPPFIQQNPPFIQQNPPIVVPGQPLVQQNPPVVGLNPPVVQPNQQGMTLAQAQQVRQQAETAKFQAQDQLNQVKAQVQQTKQQVEAALNAAKTELTAAKQQLEAANLQAQQQGQQNTPAQLAAQQRVDRARAVLNQAEQTVNQAQQQRQAQLAQAEQVVQQAETRFQQSQQLVAQAK